MGWFSEHRFACSFIVGCLYKHPNIHVSGLDKNYIKTLLDILFKEKQFSILGHFNINLLNYNNHQPNNEFLDSINSNLFMPYILQSTRIASHSKSFTDNVVHPLI